jgi:A/G-specific adenine glycosylase
MAPTEDTKAGFQRDLLLWFEENQRSHLPWRLTTDPYAILVAEKLLQQTSARQLVIDAYIEIMQRFPSPQALSQANSGELKTLIRSLGFMYRADELISMAQQLVARYGGEVPKALDKLLELPGIGQYCARAVLSFAFNKDTAIVDTNVARFLYRLYDFSDAIPSSPAINRRLIKLAEALIPINRGREYNLAVLDLCAFVCVKRNPRCLECPVLAYCTYGSKRVNRNDEPLKHIE